MYGENYEQMVELYQKIGLYCGVMALIFFAVVLILFFRLEIGSVCKELKGRYGKTIKILNHEENVTRLLKSISVSDEKKQDIDIGEQCFVILKSVIEVHTSEEI